MECLEIYEIFLYSYSDRRGGIPLGGYFNAKLSAQMRHSQRMKTYHVTHKYGMSNQTIMYIFKNSIYNYLSVNEKNIHSIIFFCMQSCLCIQSYFFCKLLYKLNFLRMKSLSKSSEKFSFFTLLKISRYSEKSHHWRKCYCKVPVSDFTEFHCDLETYR